MSRWLRNAILIFLSLFILLAIAGASYQHIQAGIDAQRFRQEGKSIDVGGFRLNLNCVGQGNPTVVLEAGLEEFAMSWRRVQAGIARFARVCSYDRAGYGWSDPGPMPRTIAQIVRELHAVLKNSGEEPPFILVGHSFGGEIVRVYNDQYPNEVQGMVLVDAGHEKLYESLPPGILKAAENDVKERQWNRAFAPILFRLGVTRFFARKQLTGAAEPTPPQKARYLRLQPNFIEATTSEVENMRESLRELASTRKLGDKPLIVLTAGKGFLGMPLETQEHREAHDIWVDDLQVQLAHLSTRGKRIMVPDSGHLMLFDRPDVIIEAVREVTADLRPDFR